MKHKDFLQPKDELQLSEAASMVSEGRKLRKRVLNRLRARAFRERHNAEQTAHQIR